MNEAPALPRAKQCRHCRQVKLLTSFSPFQFAKKNGLCRLCKKIENAKRYTKPQPVPLSLGPRAPVDELPPADSLQQTELFPDLVQEPPQPPQAAPKPQSKPKPAPATWREPQAPPEPLGRHATVMDRINHMVPADAADRDCRRLALLCQHLLGNRTEFSLSRMQMSKALKLSNDRLTETVDRLQRWGFLKLEREAVREKGQPRRWSWHGPNLWHDRAAELFALETAFHNAEQCAKLHGLTLYRWLGTSKESWEYRDALNRTLLRYWPDDGVWFSDYRPRPTGESLTFLAVLDLALSIQRSAVAYLDEPR